MAIRQWENEHWPRFGDETPIIRVLGNRLRDHYLSTIGDPTPERLVELLRHADDDAARRNATNSKLNH